MEINEGTNRLSALSAIDEVIKITEGKVERFKALKTYLETYPPSPEVEELIWSMVLSARGSYYS